MHGEFTIFTNANWDFFEKRGEWLLSNDAGRVL